MKTRFFTKASAAAFSLMIACGVLTGCADKDVYNPNAGKPELKPEGEYFNFTTTTNVDFDVNYGKFAAGSLLEIYTKNPIVYNQDGTYSINSEAQYKIFADTDGCFKGKVELATATEKVYIYSPSWGAPMCIEADVENGKVTIDTTVENDEISMRTMASTRANSTLKKITVNESKQLYAIVDWYRYGKIDDFNKITVDGNLTADGNISDKTIKQIQRTLWHGASSKPSNLDNKEQVRDTKHVNTSIAEAYLNDKNEKVIVTDAELSLTFLTERAGYQSTIGYYYYKTNNVPTDPSNIKKYVIVPNASIAGDSPYDYGAYNNAPIKKNTKIELLYEDEKGVLTTKFPAGYTIGYFIISDAFKPSDSKGVKGTINTSKAFIYSNKEWNKEYKGEQARFISLSTQNGTVVYGVEDGADKSYEDILFSIDCSPNEAIQDPERPVIKPDEPVITTTETTYRTYAFEDTWPTGGDYDLNDVIIEHKRQITVTNMNYVTKVEDTFTATQEKNAATFQNAFAVQFASDQRGTIVLPTGAIDELSETSSVILFPNANMAKDQQFTVTRTFGKEELTKDKLKTDIKSLNPFIISQYIAGEINRKEVHLPKNQPTSKADPTQVGAQDDAYYINKNGKYPFAIMLPERSASEAEINFKPATEKISIDKEYPDFTKWVESEGKDFNDWYLNYKPI